MTFEIPQPDDLGPDPEPLGSRFDTLAATRPPSRGRRPHEVLIAGAGVAGLEALTVLRALGGDRLHITVLDPGTEFTVQALSVADPFAIPGARRYALRSICEDHGADLAHGELASVGWNSIRTQDGSELPFDSLIVAVGAAREAVYPQALTFRDARDIERMHGLIQDIEGGYAREIAFVVPPGPTWPLPLYELALLTAARADTLCLDWLTIRFLTPERAPLAQFGEPTSTAVAEALAVANIDFVPSTLVAAFDQGALLDGEGRFLQHAQRVVALPRLAGPGIDGLPVDGDGFILSDAYARVDAHRGVYAVGDGSTQMIKQGGVGAQQAVTAATHVAMRAGANVDPVPFQPTLRAKLLTGSGAWYLRTGGAGTPAVVSTHALWWPPAKLAAPHLAAYLQRRDDGERGPAPAPVLSVLHAEGDPVGGIELLGA